jgi:hypothetical protein
VRGSIYQVARLINTGYWGDINDLDDIYIEMYPSDWDGLQAGQDPFDEGLGDKVRKENRNLFKRYAMRVFFGSSRKQVQKQSSWCFTTRKPRTGEETTPSEIYWDHGWNEEQLNGSVDAFFDSMETVVGRSCASEIFFHESNIYLDVIWELIQSGATVYNCYDAFYWGYPQDLKEKPHDLNEWIDSEIKNKHRIKESDIRIIIKNKAEEYYKTWILPYKNQTNGKEDD